MGESAADIQEEENEQEQELKKQQEFMLAHTITLDWEPSQDENYSK